MPLCKEQSSEMKKPEISVDINPSLADDAIEISISGLDTNERITIHAHTTVLDDATFESCAFYIADSEGNVSLSTQQSQGGTYQGVEPMGLFWSMVPSPRNKRQHERFMIKEPSNPFTVSLDIYSGFFRTFEDIAATPPSSIVARLDVTRTYMAPGVQEFDVKDGNVRATLFLPPGDGPFPGVISMSGGYAGAMKHKAALLASRGFATLALAYFGVDDLPSTYMLFDLNYCVEAANFLKNHPAVAGNNGVGIVANCYGGFLGLATASCAPKGLINCVVTINGWFAESGGITYQGKAVKRAADIIYEWEHYGDGSIKQMADVTNDDDDIVNVSYDFRPEIAYLLVLGGQDASVNTRKVAKHAKMRLDSISHSDYQILFYPDAGHLIENQYSIHGKVAWTLHMFQYYGGVQPAHAKAEIDSWPKILAFLRRNLAKCQSKL